MVCHTKNVPSVRVSKRPLAWDNERNIMLWLYWWSSGAVTYLHTECSENPGHLAHWRHRWPCPNSIMASKRTSGLRYGKSFAPSLFSKKGNKLGVRNELCSKRFVPCVWYWKFFYHSIFEYELHQWPCWIWYWHHNVQSNIRRERSSCLPVGQWMSRKSSGFTAVSCGPAWLSQQVWKISLLFLNKLVSCLWFRSYYR